MIRRAFLIGGLAGMLAACSGSPAGGGAGNDSGGGTVVHGTVTVPATAPSTAADCSAWNNYPDIAPGAKVTIKNQSGDIVGATTLGRPASGGMVPHTPVSGADLLASFWDKSCVFVFEAPIEGDAKFYTVMIGSREGPTVSASDLKAQDWTFALVIGPS
jgi:hypothetical protein